MHLCKYLLFTIPFMCLVAGVHGDEQAVSEREGQYMTVYPQGDLATEKSKSFTDMFNLVIEKLQEQFLGEEESNPWADQVAHVRASVDLPQEEYAYLDKRMPKVAEQVEHLTGERVSGKKAPRIGMAFSGGGFRAMVATTGALQGAAETGLLDAVTYTASLSGSTWAVAPLMTSALSVPDFKDYLVETAGKGVQGVGNNLADFYRKL
jgi:phospholipase A2